MLRNAVMFVVVFLPGCAAVFNGTKQTVNFDSHPTGAELSVNGNYLGKAPVDAQIDRSRSQSIKATKDGYEASEVYVKREPQPGWFFWDIATCVVPITLCIPVLVDAISSAWFGFDERYTVELNRGVEPNGPPPTSQPVRPQSVPID